MNVIFVDVLSSMSVFRQVAETGNFSSEKNVTFLCADAQLHQFESMALDAAFSRFGVMFFDDPVAALNNIRQALRPGGRITFICWQPVKANQWVNLPLKVVADHVVLPAPADPEAPGPFSFGDANRIIRILTGAGFSDTSIKQFDTTFNVGENLDEAVAFLTNIRPASVLINELDVNDPVRSRINTDLHGTLTSFKTTHGVVLKAATWIVTAYNSK